MIVCTGLIIGNRTVSAVENMELQMDADWIKITTDTVLDLRGHDACVYVESGYVEIKDTLGEGRLISYDGINGGLSVDTNASVVVFDNVKIYDAKVLGTAKFHNCIGEGILHFFDGSIVSINGGTFQSIYTDVNSDTTISAGYIQSIESKGKVNMNGGEIHSAIVKQSTFTMHNGKVTKGGIVVDYGATFQMDRGVFDNACISQEGNFFMNGGTITTDGKAAVLLNGQQSNTVISGGTINAKNAAVFTYPFTYTQIAQGAWNRTGNITIKGGTITGKYIVAKYNQDQSKYYQLYDTHENTSNAQECTTNLFIRGGKISVVEDRTQSNDVDEFDGDEQTLYIYNQVKAQITGGEFDVPVQVENQNMTISNAKFYRGLGVYNEKNTSIDMQISMNQCVVNKILDVDNYSSKKMNIIINGGSYDKAFFRLYQRGNVTINSGNFQKDVFIGGDAILVNKGTTFTKSTDIEANEVYIQGGKFQNGASVDNAKKVIISGGTFYNKKGGALYLNLPSIQKLNFSGGTFKTGKKQQPAIYISYKKKAKLNFKKIHENFIKKKP